MANYGLLFCSNSEPVKLKSVSIEGLVTHGVGQVQLTQIFQNDGKNRESCFYFLPLRAKEMVTSFSAKIVEGPGVLSTTQEDVTAGNGETFKNSEGFKVPIGVIEPFSRIEINIVWVMGVATTEGRKRDQLKFSIPPTVAPLSTTSEVIPLDIRVDICIQGKIALMYSTTHSIRKEDPLFQDHGWSSLTAFFDGTAADLQREFAILITPEEINGPRVYTQTGSEYMAVMLHMIPLLYQTEQKTEILFLMDQSGSMSGAMIKIAKNVLQLFMNSLPSGACFNIIGYGAKPIKLFPASKENNLRNWSLACDHVKDMDANLVQTGVVEALRIAFTEDQIPNRARIIIVITDAEFPNSDHTISLCEQNAHLARVSVVGVGNGPIDKIIQDMAFAGGGISRKICDYSDEMDEAVRAILADASQPAVTDVKIEWIGTDGHHVRPPIETTPANEAPGFENPITGGLDTLRMVKPPELGTFWVVPQKNGPILKSSPLVCLAIFCSQHAPTKVVIRFNSPTGQQKITAEVSYRQKLEWENDMLFNMASVLAIREDEIKSDVGFLMDSNEESNDSDTDSSFFVNLIRKRKYPSFYKQTARMSTGPPVPKQFRH